MADPAKRKRALENIRDHIEQFGHHVYVIGQMESPRFAYTIGLSQSNGFELVLCGAALYSMDEVPGIINTVAENFKAASDPFSLQVDVPAMGRFTLREVHNSWTKEMLLGALDYYSVGEIPALQLVPEDAHWTVDIPDMSRPWDPVAEPVWRWLREPWPYSVSSSSVAITSLSVLRGSRVTEAVRWEEEEWEMFDGDGSLTPEDEVREVPLATLIAADPTLLPVLDLGIEDGIWREDDQDWQEWQNKSA